jgi:hypothetical protein
LRASMSAVSRSDHCSAHAPLRTTLRLQIHNPSH